MTRRIPAVKECSGKTQRGKTVGEKIRRGKDKAGKRPVGKRPITVDSFQFFKVNLTEKRILIKHMEKLMEFDI